MKNLNYYLCEVPMTKGKFMARTIMNNTYTENELISVMRNTDQTFSESDIKKMLKNMVICVQKLLSQGIAVYVPNFLRISPVVKGVFNSPEEGYNPSKHWVGINCTIASSLINDFQKEVSVERITRPLNWPDITAIYNCETKENVIYTDFANHIAGDNLIMANYEINGIIIALKSDINQSILIGTNNLGVVSHKTKELTFTIRKNFASPVWLVKDEEVLIKIRYKNPEGYTRETDSLETRWGG